MISSEPYYQQLIVDLAESIKGIAANAEKDAKNLCTTLELLEKLSKRIEYMDSRLIDIEGHLGVTRINRPKG